MKYNVEYKSAKDGLVYNQIIEATSEGDATRKLIEKYKKEPSKVISCRRVKDMKVKDAFDIKKGAIFKDREKSERSPWYLKVMNVNNEEVTFQVLQPDTGKSEPMKKWPINRFKSLLESRYKQVNSLYDSKKKFRINNKIITADSATQALKLYKALDSQVKDAKPNDYRALARELQQKFNTKFIADPANNGIEAPYVYGDWNLDKKIVSYLRAKGYKLLFDRIDDAGYYTFTDSVKDAKPIIVKNIPYTNNSQIVLQSEMNGKDVYWVVGKEQYHGEKEYNGGASLCLNLNEAKRQATNYDIIDKLEKKYGKNEGYKRWMAGKKDSVKDDLRPGAIMTLHQDFEAKGFPVKIIKKLSEAEKRKAAPGHFNPDAGDYYEVESSSSILGKRRYIVWEKRLSKDSIKDDDLETLSEEEKQAIDDYKAAIANTTDPKLLRLFAHILNEEIDHLEELQTQEIEDEINGTYAIRNGIVYVWVGGKLVGKFTSIEEAKDIGYNLDDFKMIN